MKQVQVRTPFRSYLMDLLQVNSSTPLLASSLVMRGIQPIMHDIYVSNTVKKAIAQLAVALADHGSIDAPFDYERNALPIEPSRI